MGEKARRRADDAAALASPSVLQRAYGQLSAPTNARKTHCTRERTRSYAVEEMRCDEDAMMSGLDGGDTGDGDEIWYVEEIQDYRRMHVHSRETRVESESEESEEISITGRPVWSEGCVERIGKWYLCGMHRTV